MKNRQKKMRAKVMTVIFGYVLIVSISGCGKADRDDIAEDLYSVNTDDADMNPVSGDDKAEERLQYTMQGSNGRKITVDAVIEFPDVLKINTYEEIGVHIDDGSLAEFAGAVFDNGEYEIIKPYEICSEEELKQAKVTLETEAAGYEADAVPTAIRENLDDVNYYLNNPKEITYIETVENQILYRLPDGTREWRLQGKIDGETWAVFGFASEYEGEAYQILRLSPYDANRNWSHTVGMSDAAVEKNVCDLQNARNSANEAMEKLGYGDMTVIDTKQLMPEGGNMENLEGYRFTYGKCPDGIAVLYIDNYFAMVEGTDLKSEQEYVHVYVNAEGVANIEFTDTYKMGDAMSENMAVMPFDKVDEIARAEMVNYLEDYSGTDITVTEVRMGYMTITYDGAKYALVPAWIYYVDGGSYNTNKQGLFAINALDGGVINFSRY